MSDVTDEPRLHPSPRSSFQPRARHSLALDNNDPRSSRERDTRSRLTTMIQVPAESETLARA
eukprot:423327-Prymnesium_polylepis.1